MKVSALPKKGKSSIGKVSKNKVVKKKEKDATLSMKKSALELASEVLPPPDRKKLSNSLKKQKSASGPSSVNNETSNVSASKVTVQTLSKALKRGNVNDSVVPSLKKKRAPKKIKDMDANSKTTPGLLRSILDAACSSALKFIKKDIEARSGKELFGSEPEEISLQIQLFKVPKTPYKHIRCAVPNPIYPVEPEVCLIVPDLFRGRRSDSAFAQVKETYEARLRSTGVQGIKMLIPFTQMRYEYRQFEMRRRLSKSFDLFLCDGRIFGHCSQFLGKQLNKPLVPIHATVRNKGKVSFVPFLQDEVNKAIQKSTFIVTPHGSTIAVKNVGHTELTPVQLADNIEAIWKSLEEQLPGGIKNIQTAFLKGPLSPPIPLYASFTPLEEVPVGKFREIGEPVEDELSTQLGVRVTVHPSGDIDIKDEPSKEDVHFMKMFGLRRFNSEAEKDADNNVSHEGDNETNDVKAVPTAKFQPVEREVLKTDLNADQESSDDDIADAAEDAYLQNWSESVSIRELEDDGKKKQQKKKNTKRAPRKPASKPAAKAAAKTAGSVGISMKYSKGVTKGKKNVKSAAKKKA